MRGVNVSMMIDGLPVRKIRHEGRTFLPVMSGDKFTILVENNTSERVAAIVSVDGRSIMTGDSASHNDTGYVVNAYGRVEIKGFRKGLDASKQFVVTTDSGDSYDERRGGSGVNKGVIGVVIKPEKKKKKVYRHRDILVYGDEPNRNNDVFASMELKGAQCCLNSPVELDHEVPTSGGINLPDEPVMKCCSFSGQHTNSTKSASRRISAPAAKAPAGTKMGDLQTDRVVEVSFEEDNNRKSVIILYYDTVEGLKNKGVPIEYLHPLTPDPFPAEPRTACYCPDA